MHSASANLISACIEPGVRMCLRIRIWNLFGTWDFTNYRRRRPICPSAKYLALQSRSYTPSGNKRQLTGALPCAGDTNRDSNRSIVSRLRAPPSSCDADNESEHEEGARRRGTIFSEMSDHPDSAFTLSLDIGSFVIHSALGLPSFVILSSGQPPITSCRSVTKG